MYKRCGFLFWVLKPNGGYPENPHLPKVLLLDQDLHRRAPEFVRAGAGVAAAGGLPPLQPAAARVEAIPCVGRLGNVDQGLRNPSHY